MILPLPEYITLLNEKLETLIPHSFISKKQSEYIKKRKENVSENEVLCFMDFSENYGFILQDDSKLSLVSFILHSSSSISLL